MEYSYAFFEASAAYVRWRLGFAPEIAVILGSSLGPFAGEIEDPVVIDYCDIPHFLTSTVATHAGKLIGGTVAGKKVVCMSGRFHTYEGYSYEQLVLPIRIFKLLGVKATILTNAAGAINAAYRPGDVMVISDHIKLNGDSPPRRSRRTRGRSATISRAAMLSPNQNEIRAQRKVAVQRSAESAFMNTWPKSTPIRSGCAAITASD